jgi:hypothetical protein
MLVAVEAVLQVYEEAPDALKFNEPLHKLKLVPDG